IFSFAANTGTFGVAPRDAGIASASVNTGQQLGGSIGTALLNTIASTAITAYIADHIASAHDKASQLAIQAQGAIDGYHHAFWLASAIFAAGAIITAIVLRPGVPEEFVHDSGEQPAMIHA
ncbi:MAG: hypothetical protein FWF16_07920, partial [Microbacteriaceae bacterium]|nr:hypothetical protein [Microbacteriaceae bacterium]